MTLPSRFVVGAHLQWLRHRSAIHAPNQKHWSGTSGNMSALVEAGGKREAYVPVLLLWAFPAVIVVGSVRYYSGRAVHKAELLEQRKGPMADQRALKLIGIMFAALTLTVISTAAVVVAGPPARLARGQYDNGG